MEDRIKFTVSYKSKEGFDCVFVLASDEKDDNLVQRVGLLLKHLVETGCTPVGYTSVGKETPAQKSKAGDWCPIHRTTMKKYNKTARNGTATKQMAHGAMERNDHG